MLKISVNIYTWLFLVNSKTVLLLPLVKYMLCSYCTQSCIFSYILEAENHCFVTKNCLKPSYICAFILSKKTGQKIHNQGIAGHRKLPDHSLNRSFNALSIVVQYTLSFIQIILAWSAYFRKNFLLINLYHRDSCSCFLFNTDLLLY